MPHGNWLGQGALWLFWVFFALVFSLRALFRRGRGTHTYGVGARGYFKAVDEPSYPLSEFFAQTRTSPIQIRHATALRSDEASKDFRSIAVKFLDEAGQSSLDLVMNTGRVQGFWHVANFVLGIMGGALGDFGRRLYIRLQPPAFDNVNAGIRRAPESFASLEYYAALSFDYSARDGKRRICRFRVIPHNRGKESGLPDAKDLSEPWHERRRPSENKSADHLRREYRNRITREGVVRYWLQIQTHDLDQDRSDSWYNIGRAWPEETHRWHDVGELIIEQALSSEQSESLRFQITRQPPDLGIPHAHSPWDYRSIGWMRSRIYPRLQTVRQIDRTIRTKTRLGTEVAWDAPAVSARKRFRKPQTVTFLIPLSGEQRKAVEDCYRETYDHWFEHLRETRWLHYYRSFFLDRAGEARLAINLIYDGPVRNVLDELAEVTHGNFQRLLAAAGAPEGLFHKQREWLIPHGEKARTFYIGGVGLSRAEIDQENHLRGALNQILDTHESKLRPASCESIRRFLKQTIGQTEDPLLPQGPGESNLWATRVGKLADMAWSLANPLSGLLIGDVWSWACRRPQVCIRLLLFAILTLWTVYVALPTGLFLLLVRSLERTEAEPPEAEVTLAHLRQLEASENLRLQNNLTMYAAITDSWMRRWILACIFYGAEKGTRHLWADGNLADINTIHFARFHLLDDRRSMLFLSDYDGSWGRYLGDFLSVGRRAVVPIWSNLAGCPKTHWLFQPTSGFGGKFMRFTRARQIDSLLWFSAYPNLSMTNILNNQKLRNGLFADQMSEREARDWLRCLNR